MAAQNGHMAVAFGPPQNERHPGSPRLGLDTLPNEIQQLIYYHVIAGEPFVQYEHRKFTGLAMLTYDLIRVSPVVRSNLREAVRLYGDEKLQRHVKGQLQIWAETSRKGLRY